MLPRPHDARRRRRVRAPTEGQVGECYTHAPYAALVRVLAACSLGGAGHLNPLLPFLHAARRAGNETLVIAPPAMEEMVEGTGFPYRAGGEPPEADVAPIRGRLPV